MVNSRFAVDIAGCVTYLECTPGPPINFTLFNDQACPIGGPCLEGSPVILVPAEGCDNCDLNLPAGRIEIHWTCDGGEALMMAAAPTDAQRTGTLTYADSECIHRGVQIGEHVCEPCGIRGTILPVYQCNLLDRPCVRRWWTNSLAKREASGEVNCNTCRERTLSDGTKPWDWLPPDDEPRFK
jgi:hypothetical protein